MRRVELLADDVVQCFQQALAWCQAVNGDVFHAIRDPDVHHRRRTQLFAKVRGDATAGFAVVNPELADAVVSVCQRETVGTQRMREA
ncbi:hypothetical protein D3C73_1326050 [compost metagenome]